MRIALLLTALASTLMSQASPPAPASVRLYILDCGTIVGLDPRFSDLKPQEVKGSLDLITPCYLVVHPSGTLMWDVGEIPDADMPPNGPGSQGRFYRVNKKLLPQLEDLGYTPRDITYLGLSHYHSDHTANANEFAGSTWIVQEPDRTAMFTEPAPNRATPAEYSKLRDAKTVLNSAR